MSRLAVGVLGAGKHGERYLRHASRDVPEITVAALARRNTDLGRAQAAALGCRYHADWRALVDDPHVEAVVVVVTPDLHGDIVEAVARARKPLLIEKPLALSGPQALAIARTVRRANVPHLVGQTLRWNTVVNEIRDRLPALGPLRALQLNQRFEPSDLDWLDDPTRGGVGVLTHTGVHSFDLVRYLTGGDVRRVWCRTSRAATVRTDDNFLALLELAGSDALVSVSGSRATLGRSGLIDAAARDGQLVGDHLLHFAYGIRERTRSPLHLPEPAHTVCEVLRSFVRVTRGEEAPRATVEDGARAVQIADACRMAARSGSSADVPALG